MKLAIVGAGPSGLSVLREAVNENFECTVFEQSDKIGGLWNYSENISENLNRLPVHSGIYEGMVTNIPKEIMAFDDFPYEEPNNSFISPDEVLKYIHKFAKKFELIKHIKLNTQVVFIEPVDSYKWLVRKKNLETMDVEECIFDAVAVCNGHLYEPNYPTIPGKDLFTGNVIHSHVYRKPEDFKDKVVLVVGAGPSGSDISRILATVSKKVIISYREKPQNVIKCFTETSAVFDDGSEEIIDSVIFCTGYNTSLPFLSPQCEITVEDNWVKPLYKHIINIERPSMAIINVTDFTLTFPLSGLQARFFIAFLKGKFQRTKEEMLKDLEEEIETIRKNGASARCTHQLAARGMEKYCDELASIAGIENNQTVFNKIFDHCFNEHFQKFYKYKILNDKEFEVFKLL